MVYASDHAKSKYTFEISADLLSIQFTKGGNSDQTFVDFQDGGPLSQRVRGFRERIFER